MARKKNEKPAETLKPGDHVIYDGAEWEVVELFGSGKYAVIYGEAGRFSADVTYLKKVEA